MSTDKKILLFDYGSINEDHKKAIREVIKLAKEMDNIVFADYISHKFKIKEENKFELKDSIFFKLCKENDINVHIQGYVQDGINPDAIQYPMVSITEDVRKLDKIFQK